MVKPRGALKKGRAADGKLNSHLQWPNPIDYRPISLLSTVSKLLEKHVYKLLWQHLNANGLVSDSQWAATWNARHKTLRNQ